ncbi:MAG TPA: TrkA C-terminal domain-containing protein, partial [Phycisphaerae bacterium]|nr:TrkA C-terminal domain-containing protein [Phycisphaerae bacterium]
WSVAIILLILMVVGVTILAVKIGTIALRLTGMEERRASFQALSAVTGTGFTTREAEMVMVDPRRRRIIGILMVFGNAVLVTLISLLVTVFMSRAEWFEIPVRLVLLALGGVLIYALLHMRGFTGRIKGWLYRKMMTRMRIQEHLVCEVLALAEGYGVAEVWVRPELPFAGKTLAEARLREQGMLVLAIRREGRVLPSPSGDERILPEDRLICYGELARIHAMAGAEEPGQARAI